METMPRVQCNCEAAKCYHGEGYCTNFASNFVYVTYSGRICSECAPYWIHNVPDSIYVVRDEDVHECDDSCEHWDAKYGRD